MGLSLRKLFKAREKPGEDVQRVSSVEIADQQVRDAVTEICLRELAFWTCVGKIANALTKCEFRTFYEGEELFKDEYYLWNYEPNRNQNKAEFLSKAMEQLFRNNELLIVESYDGQLLVADDFSVTKMHCMETLIPMCRWMITHFRGHSEVQTCFTGRSTTRM